MAGLGDGRGISEASPRWELQTPAAPKSCHIELPGSTPIVRPCVSARACSCSNPKTRDSAVSELCQNPMAFGCQGLAFERKQTPQVVENTEKWCERMEGLEQAGVLRRQMLYPAELRARSPTLPNSALKRPVFEVIVPLAPQIANANMQPYMPRPSASKVRRGGLYPAELRAHRSFPQSYHCASGLRF